MRLDATHPLQLALGLAVWFAWFCLAYAGMSVACSVAAPAPQAGVYNWINGTLLLVTVATAAALAWAAWTCSRAAGRVPAAADDGRRRFVARSAALLHTTAAIATLALGLPMVLLPPCV